MRQYCWIIGCVFSILQLVPELSWCKELDEVLNYSMKRKVYAKKLQFLFPSDRANESTYGPSLEQPNCGTYLPAFVMCVISYVICVISLICVLAVHFIIKNDMVDMYIMIAAILLPSENVLCIRILHEHYLHKYAKHQPEHIELLNAEIEKHNDTSKNNDQI